MKICQDHKEHDLSRSKSSQEEAFFQSSEPEEKWKDCITYRAAKQEGVMV